MVYRWVGLLALATAALVQLAPPSESAHISDLSVELNENILGRLEASSLAKM
ncbi:hypothetical protein H4R34_005975, partial [Dimargaris verticillata]